MRRDEVEAPGSGSTNPHRLEREDIGSAQAYAAGTWGPRAAIALIERDGRSWYDARHEPANKPLERHDPPRDPARGHRETDPRTHPRYLDLMATAEGAAGDGQSPGRCPAATSPTASPPAEADKARSAAPARPNIGDRHRLQRHAVGASALRTFSRLIKIWAREVGASRSSPAACRPCATASPRARPAWSCRCSAAT